MAWIVAIFLARPAAVAASEPQGLEAFILKTMDSGEFGAVVGGDAALDLDLPGVSVDSRSGAFFRSGFAVPSGTYPNNHGASLAELADGKILITWFAGSREGGRDAQIYSVAHDPGTGAYSPPSILVRKREWPGGGLWPDKSVGNTALYVDDEGFLWLFYNAISLGGWSGAVINYKVSRDGGKTWSEGRRLVGAFGNLVRTSPLPLGPGAFLLPAYTELLTHKGYACRVEHRRGKVQALNCGDSIDLEGAIQPALVRTRRGRILALLRDQGRQGIRRSWSEDEGVTWSPPDTIGLPNPGAAVAATDLDDGRILLVYNHSRENRTPLSLAVSQDDGETFQKVVDLESGPGGFSYPAILQSRDGLVHVVYTYNRKTIRHLTFHKSWLAQPSGRPAAFRN